MKDFLIFASQLFLFLCLLFAVLTYPVEAKPYIRIGGTMSTRDHVEIKTDCQISAIGLVGYKFKEFSAEARYSQTMSQDSLSYGLYGLKHINKTIYILGGIGKTEYDNIEDATGIRIGAGMQLRKLGVEAVCRPKEKDCTINLLFRF